MIIKLPKPPSVNLLYGQTARGGFVQKYMSAEGKRWFVTAGKILHDNLKSKEPIDYKITLNAYLSTAKGQDVDNIAKALCDLLQKCQLCLKNRCSHKFKIIRNDSLIYELHIIKRNVPHLNEECVEIEILPFSLEQENPCVIELPIQFPEF